MYNECLTKLYDNTPEFKEKLEIEYAKSPDDAGIYYVVTIVSDLGEMCHISHCIEYIPKINEQMNATANAFNTANMIMMIFDVAQAFGT